MAAITVNGIQTTVPDIVERTSPTMDKMADWFRKLAAHSEAAHFINAFNTTFFYRTVAAAATATVVNTDSILDSVADAALNPAGIPMPSVNEQMGSETFLPLVYKRGLVDNGIGAVELTLTQAQITEYVLEVDYTSPSNWTARITNSTGGSVEFFVVLIFFKRANLPQDTWTVV